MKDPGPGNVLASGESVDNASSNVNPKQRSGVGNLWTDSAAALISSTIFATTFYPFHRIKILLQTQDSNPLVVSGQVARYNVLDAAPRLVREGGVRELWRGAAAYMVRHVPSTTLSFAFKDAVLRLLPKPPPAPESPGQIGIATAIHLAAGFVGGAAALFLVYPLDFATIRMASELRHHKKSQSVMDTLNSTQRSGGLAALYRGYGVSAAAIGAYKALYFGLYDTACAVMQHRRATAAAATSTARASAASPSGEHGPASLPTAGGLAPIAYAAATARPSPGAGPSTSHFPNKPAYPAEPSGPSRGGPGGAAAGGSGGASGSPSDLGLLERWAVANVVVLAASSLTYPLDVVRKRLVADTAMGPGRQQYAGLADCVAKMARTEGLRGFYRFYGADMLLRLGGGVLLVLYDELKAYGPAGVVRELMGRDPGAHSSLAARPAGR